MLQSSGKRAAFSPPPDSRPRPTKRLERSSSPEEGELDDADPPHSLHVSSPHLPSALGTTPPASNYSVRVKLPFKTKANPTTETGAGASVSNNFKGVSTRPISLGLMGDQQLMVGSQLSKKAGPRKTRQLLAGVGTGTLIPKNRCTALATFVTDAGIDHILDLRRARLSETMAGLAGRKFALDHAPGPLRVLRPAPDLRRGSKPTDYRPTAPEALHRHFSLVVAT